jgi:hypothetical protein
MVLGSARTVRVVPCSRRSLGSCSLVGPVVWIVVGLGSRPKVPLNTNQSSLHYNYVLHTNFLRICCGRWNAEEGRAYIALDGMLEMTKNYGMIQHVQKGPLLYPSRKMMKFDTN